MADSNTTSKILCRQCDGLPEEWRDTLDYPDYQVSSYGRLLSFKRPTPRILHGTTSDNGYELVHLTKDRHLYGHHIARLVLLSFIGPDPDPAKNQVNHKDGIKLHNHLDNYEWESAAGQMEHAKRLGLLHPASGDNHGLRKHPERRARGIHHGTKTQPERIARGSRNGGARLTEADILVIRWLLGPGKRTRTEVAQPFNISWFHVRKIDLRLRWNHMP